MIHRAIETRRYSDTEPVHEYYQRSPFCNPEHSIDDADSIIFNFDPLPSAHASVLRQEASRLYQIEKQRDFFSQLEREDGDHQIDLTDRAALEGMRHHVLVHSGAGLMRWGTSDTYSIPYWDREAYQHAARLQYGAEDAKHETKIADALNINVLRTFVAFLSDRTWELSEDVAAVAGALDRGQETRVSIADRQQAELGVVTREHQTFRNVYAAKLKHLLWLTDQQHDPALRHGLMRELVIAVDAAQAIGVSEDELTVDMGIDTGISEDTYRPAYVISGFRQLGHVGSETFSLPQQYCHRVNPTMMIESISRPTHGKPFYDDGRYDLPWNFTAGGEYHEG